MTWPSLALVFMGSQRPCLGNPVLCPVDRQALSVARATTRRLSSTRTEKPFLWAAWPLLALVFTVKASTGHAWPKKWLTWPTVQVIGMPFRPGVDYRPELAAKDLARLALEREARSRSR